MATRSILAVDDCRFRQQLDQLAFEKSRHFFAWIQADAQIARANQSFCEHLGYDENAIVGLHLLHLELETTTQTLEQRFREIKEEGPVVYRAQWRHCNGTALPLELTAQLVKQGDHEICLFEARPLESTTTATHNDANPVAWTRVPAEPHAEHLDRLRSMGLISAAVAHELSQPLAAISNNAFLLQRLFDELEYPLNDAPDLASLIYEQAILSTEIVSRMKGFLAGKQIPKKLVDINPIILETLKLVDTQLHHAGIEQRLDLLPDAPQIYADRVQIQQLLINLILNAIHAIDESKKNRREIDLRTKVEDDLIKVEVEDSGSGLPEIWNESVFEPYFSTKPDGMGMGLAICKSIIENHDGRISAKSVANGTIIRIELPVADVTSSFNS